MSGSKGGACFRFHDGKHEEMDKPLKEMKMKG
jgi:hypothetical protein